MTQELESNFAFYSALREPLLLSVLDHPNIINFKGVLRREASTLYFLYVILIKFDCAQDAVCSVRLRLLCERSVPILDDAGASTIYCLPSLRGVELSSFSRYQFLFFFSHSDIVHRDIQPSSILLSTSSEQKMQDRKILSVKLAVCSVESNAYHFLEL